MAVFAVALVASTMTPAAMTRWVVIAAVVVLALRAVGDGRWVVFSKRVRSTPFARRDDRLFTPVVVALVLGGLAALAV